MENWTKKWKVGKIQKNENRKIGQKFKKSKNKKKNRKIGGKSNKSKKKLTIEK